LKVYSSARPVPTEWLFCLVCWARTQRSTFRLSTYRPALVHRGPQMLSNEMDYKLMRLLDAKPQVSQRDAARELGVSLGKINYCVQALIRKGWLKAARFKSNRNKAAYMYLLTPRGLEEKAALTLEFLRIKTREYEMLRADIAQIRREAKGDSR
jgi:EPS-associated MarR family transcriptional regulator